MTTRKAQPEGVPTTSECLVSAQALCRGPLETSVFGVARSSARPGDRAHIGIKFGRILFYLEDRQALDNLVEAVEQATTMADAAFGPVEDVFTEAEARARLRFERSGNVADLRQ